MSEAPGTHNPNVLPSDIPIPQDDGRARHLTGIKLNVLRVVERLGGGRTAVETRYCHSEAVDPNARFHDARTPDWGHHDRSGGSVC